MKMNPHFWLLPLIKKWETKPHRTRIWKGDLIFWYLIESAPHKFRLRFWFCNFCSRPKSHDGFFGLLILWGMNRQIMSTSSFLNSDYSEAADCHSMSRPSCWKRPSCVVLLCCAVKDTVTMRAASQHLCWWHDDLMTWWSIHHQRGGTIKCVDTISFCLRQSLFGFLGNIK